MPTPTEHHLPASPSYWGSMQFIGLGVGRGSRDTSLSSSVQKQPASRAKKIERSSESESQPRWWHLSGPLSNASVLQSYTFLVCSFSLSTLGPHFCVFPACSAAPKGIFETFIFLLKLSVYPPCSLSAHDLEFLLTEERDSCIQVAQLLCLPLNLSPFIACLPACLPAIFPSRLNLPLP